MPTLNNDELKELERELQAQVDAQLSIIDDAQFEIVNLVDEASMYGIELST